MTLCNLMDCSHQAPLSMGILQARILDWVAIFSSGGSSQPRDQTQVSHIAADSLPSEPPGKPKNTGVGSLSLLQGIFLTQESNQSLLQCGQILYQLSYQGSPRYKRWLMGKESACNARDPGLIPGSGRSPGEWIGYPFQYSWVSLVAQMVKNLSAMCKTWV